MAEKGGEAKTRGLYRREGSDFWWMAYGTGSGKVVRRSCGTKSKRKALQYLSKIRGQIAENRYLDVKREPRSTLGEIVNWYLSRPNCGVRDKFSCRPIVSYFGADRRFSDIDAKSLMDYQKFRLKQTRRQGDRLVCERTVNRELSFISAMANRAIKGGLAVRNPARGIEKFAERRRTQYCAPRRLRRFWLRVVRGRGICMVWCSWRLLRAFASRRCLVSNGRTWISGAAS